MRGRFSGGDQTRHGDAAGHINLKRNAANHAGRLRPLAATELKNRHGNFMLGGYQEAAVDFVADNSGLTLFHCHQQLHIHFGFTTLFDYI